MIWLVPAAWAGAIAVAVPIVLHLLARPRAEVQPFPTLRFLWSIAPAARRRRRLDRLPLLAVRCAILVAAAAALAGPLLTTAGRRAAWNATLVEQTVDARDGAIRGRLSAAVAALAAAPPGRRAIVVRSTFPLGSLTDADIAAVPNEIGLSFERVGSLPAREELAAPDVLERDRGSASARGGTDAPGPADARISRRVALDGPRTRVRDAGVAPDRVAIDVDGPPAARTLLAAVLTQRVLAPSPGRHARLVIAGAEDFRAQLADARPIASPWMADAVARIARDDELRAAVADVGPSDDALGRSPWLAVAIDRGGNRVAGAASDAAGRLLVATTSPPDALATAVLIRAVVNAMGPAPAPHAEAIAIEDARLRAWSRPAGAAATPRRETIDSDDRRALWVLALCLMGIEAWMRWNER